MRHQWISSHQYRSYKQLGPNA